MRPYHESMHFPRTAACLLVCASFFIVPATAAAALRTPGDLNGDGRTDQMSYDATTGKWCLQGDNGLGGCYNSLSWGGVGYSPVAGDFDGDGKEDLTLYRWDGRWFVLESSTNYTTAFAVDFGGPDYSPLRGDFDGDGRADIALYHALTGSWHVRTSSSNFAAGFRKDWGGQGYAPQTGDYDGDGRSDMGLYRAASGTWFLLTSSSSFTNASWKNWGGPGYTPVAGDFDGDGKDDLTVFYDVTGRWHILLSSTNYTTATWQDWGNGNEALLGDYDGDGKADLATYFPSNPYWTARESHSNYTTVTFGRFWVQSEPLLAVPKVPIGQPDHLQAGDQDSDRTSDIIAWGQTSGEWRILTSSSGFTSNQTLTGPGSANAIPVPGDYDGDGKMDPATFDVSTRDWWVLTSSSNYTTVRTTKMPLPFNPAIPLIPAPGDYNGDGITDMSVYSPSDYFNWFIFYSGGSSTGSSVHLGSFGDVPVPADYDGDGRTDRALFTPGTGEWNIDFTRSGDISHARRWAAHPTLGAGDIPVPGDYDADGLADVAAYRPSTGVWSVLLTTTANLATWTFTLGGSGFAPVWGDYDGDGRIDPAVYEYATGNWTIATSSSNYATTITRTLGGAGYLAVPKHQ